ncbi:TAXI family TRAP transporter solute-binding subunit [Actinomycetospora atypica]|uniref:TAXI family TRAP transporter solute-binding subunit n=1 Tax=Actinomycetospora atypica TaxID=1290095 RepID=A0ABV9YKP4_9PSEU
MTTRTPSRRTVLGAGGALALGAGIGLGAAGCAGDADGVPIALASGTPAGVYHRLGAALVDLWGTDLGARTSLLDSQGSVDNVGMLAAGLADVAFCAVDVAADGAVDGARPERPLQALARMHDDAVHVVVPASSDVRRLADLRGRRVSVGAPNSGVLVIAPRLLATVGLSPESGLVASMLGLGDSVAALRAGVIDAFFWSGGVPTAGVEDLARSVPLRLLDLTGEVDALRRVYPVYDVTTVPARAYGIGDPVTTVSVRNVLVVTAAMETTTARGLTRVLLDRVPALAAADPAGRSVDPRTAIGTQPVPLHAGAAEAYRAAKPS